MTRKFELIQKVLTLSGFRTRLKFASIQTRYLTSRTAGRHIHHMDEALPEDIEDVLELSAILEIREYDFFFMAYRWWFGCLPDDRVLERHFIRYMFNKIVPHWIRNYCRMLYEMETKGVLDREKLGVSRLPDATPQSVRAGLRYFVMLFCAVGLLVLIAEYAMQFSALPCMFPPCY